MEISKLKLLLKLAGKPGYRGNINELKPSKNTKFSQVESICKQLRDRGLVACREEIGTIKLSASGKALLKKSDATVAELKIYKACEKGAIIPSRIKFNSAKKRQEIIENLIRQGAIEVATAKIQQVWLTQRGKEYLAKEYNPRGGRAVLSLSLLDNYLRFLREYFCKVEIQTDDRISNSVTKPSDEEILQAIVNLDRELGTENYLPIFHLRNQFQLHLSREELDFALYRLQRQDKIELSSLVEAVHYTREQIEAGIPQDIGGPLFFLIITRSIALG